MFCPLGLRLGLLSVSSSPALRPLSSFLPHFSPKSPSLLLHLHLGLSSNTAPKPWSTPTPPSTHSLPPTTVLPAGGSPGSLWIRPCPPLTVGHTRPLWIHCHTNLVTLPDTVTCRSKVTQSYAVSQDHTHSHSCTLIVTDMLTYVLT